MKFVKHLPAKADVLYLRKSAVCNIVVAVPRRTRLSSSYGRNFAINRNFVETSVRNVVRALKTIPTQDFRIQVAHSVKQMPNIDKKINKYLKGIYALNFWYFEMMRNEHIYVFLGSFIVQLKRFFYKKLSNFHMSTFSGTNNQVFHFISSTL